MAKWLCQVGAAVDLPTDNDSDMSPLIAALTRRDFDMAAWLLVNTHSSGRLAPPRPPIPPLSSLTTRAYYTHTRAHFTPQHWLLCHMGLY